MFKREVENWVSWINENLPTVALLGETEVRRIVKRAINDLRVRRFVITFGGAAFGALIGEYFANLSFEPPYPDWQHLFVVIGSSSVFAYVAVKFSESLLIRRIESLASATSGK